MVPFAMMMVVKFRKNNKLEIPQLFLQRDFFLKLMKNGDNMFDWTMRGGNRMDETLEVGDLAPDFSLPATTAEKIGLSDFRDKKNIVVAFYGMDFTPG